MEKFLIGLGFATFILFCYEVSNAFLDWILHPKKNKKDVD